MARGPVFWVQPFKREGAQLVPTTAVPFTSASEAEEVGARLRGRSAGVAVYTIDRWGELEMLASFGEVPRAG